MMHRLGTALIILLFWSSLSAQDFIFQQARHTLPPKAPEMIVFAGDTVRLDRRDLHERMERELASFTFSHTNTWLMLKRSGRYFEMVVPILQLHGIPEDLKYLMAIESNLDPKALSPAGAAGMWQFMKTAGRECGLVIDEEVDERYNIMKETVAACKYLKKAYSKFNDWMTVAASYNGGQGGIEQKIADQKESSALDLWMVEETSRYMYRVLAAKMLFEHPEDFGFYLEPSDYYEYVEPKEVVTVNGQILDLVKFAKDHGVSYKMLKEENLWLRSNKLLNKGGRTYEIIIPSY